MTEFIITSEQLEIAIEAIAHELDKPINEVYIRGEKLPEIVRCRDCVCLKEETENFPALCRLWLPRNLEGQYGIEPDGFCAWGESRHER